MNGIEKTDIYFEWTDLNGNLIKEFEPSLALAYLLANDILIINDYWWKKDWPEDAKKMISFGVNCSDTFSYACADAEELLFSEIENLCLHVKADSTWGATVWCIKKRKIKPIEPIYQKLLQHELWKDDINDLFNVNK